MQNVDEQRDPLAAGRARQHAGQWAAAEASYRRALAEAELGGDRRAEAQALATLGGLLEQRGDFAEAQPLLDRAAAHFTALNDAPGVQHTLGHLGRTYQGLGRYDAALAAHERQRRIAGELGDERALGQAHYHESLVHFNRGDYAQAMTALEQALHHAQAAATARASLPSAGAWATFTPRRAI